MPNWKQLTIKLCICSLYGTVLAILYRNKLGLPLKFYLFIFFPSTFSFHNEISVIHFNWVRAEWNRGKRCISALHEVWVGRNISATSVQSWWTPRPELTSVLAFILVWHVYGMTFLSPWLVCLCDMNFFFVSEVQSGPSCSCCCSAGIEQRGPTVANSLSACCWQPAAAYDTW